MTTPEQIARETAKKLVKKFQKDNNYPDLRYVSYLIEAIQQAIETAMGGEGEETSQSRQKAISMFDKFYCISNWEQAREYMVGSVAKIIASLAQSQARVAELEGELQESKHQYRVLSECHKVDEKQYQKMQDERDAAQQELGNLYAAIFRDGGHEYQRLGENSYDAAVEKVLGAYSKMDADAIVIDILKDDLADAQQKVKDLQQFEAVYNKTCVHHSDKEREAITCPVCLRSQLDRAKEALRPFAEKAKHHDAGALKERPDGFDVGNEYTFPIGILRAAQRTLTELEGK